MPLVTPAVPSQDALGIQSTPRFPKCFGCYTKDPLYSNLPFAVSPAHTDLRARGAVKGPVWFLITASIAINRDGCLGLSHLIAMFVLEDMIQLLQAALHLTFSVGFGK